MEGPIDSCLCVFFSFCEVEAVVILFVYFFFIFDPARFSDSVEFVRTGCML